MPNKFITPDEMVASLKERSVEEQLTFLDAVANMGPAFETAPSDPPDLVALKAAQERLVEAAEAHRTSPSPATLDAWMVAARKRSEAQAIHLEEHWRRLGFKPTNDRMY